MEDNIAIKVEHLSKVYKIFDKPIDRVKESLNPFGKRYSKDFYALNDVSFTIKKGETIGIIGKNGAGKSTLLKMITGVLTPSSGTLQVNGRIASLLELGAGFNPEMTGIENIYMNGSIMGYSKEEMDEKLESIVNFADIGDFINQPVKMYSSGMFARLAFAVNVAIEPDIFIVDEALSVGDISFQTKCMRRMELMMQKGVTILLVSHAIDSLKCFCQKVFWLEKGSMEMSGEALEILNIYSQQLLEDINDINGINGINDVKVQEKFFAVSTRLDKYNDEKFFRQGTGEMRITDVFINDLYNHEIKAIEYNQEIKIVIDFVCCIDCDDVCIVYRIKNQIGIGVIGNNALSSNFEEGKEWKRKWNAGEKGRVIFKSKLPIKHGDYTVMAVISAGKSTSETRFLDWIENACSFTVSVRTPVELFDYIELSNNAKYKIEK